MMDASSTPPSLSTATKLDNPIDESPKSKFTTVSPETREAAKTTATSTFPMNAEATINIIPNIMNSNSHRSTVLLALTFDTAV